jgi:Holliday junction resolvase
MATMKAKKGNPFEKLVAFNLKTIGYKVLRPDNNIKGIDLIFTNSDYIQHAVECKRHKGFTWNQLVKYFKKTLEQADKQGIKHSLLIFKGNNQPVLVMIKTEEKLMVTEFEYFFGSKWINKVPKGLGIHKILEA